MLLRHLIHRIYPLWDRLSFVFSEMAEVVALILFLLAFRYFETFETWVEVETIQFDSKNSA